MLYHLTPAYFIKHRTSTAGHSDGVDATNQGDKVKNVSRDNGEKITNVTFTKNTQESQNMSSQPKDSSASPTGRTSPPCPSSPPCHSSPPSWRSISVSTRWRWDDIWHTQTEVQMEGNIKENTNSFLFKSFVDMYYYLTEMFLGFFAPEILLTLLSSAGLFQHLMRNII